MKSGTGRSYLLACCAFLAASPVTQADLIGHWTFDDSPATNDAVIANSSGDTVHDGTLHTVLTNAAVAGQIGGAFDFTDPGIAPKDYVDADLGADFVTGVGPASISFWMNPDAIGGQAFVFAWGRNSAGQCVRVSVENGTLGTELRYRHQGGFVAFDASAMSEASGWHHVAAVVPVGASIVGDVIYYMDGAPLNKVLDDNDALNVVANTTKLFIGSNWNGATGFDGQIDDVGWWNEALSAEDVAAIYNGGLQGRDLQQSLATPEPAGTLLLLR